MVLYHGKFLNHIASILSERGLRCGAVYYPLYIDIRERRNDNIASYTLYKLHQNPPSEHEPNGGIKCNIHTAASHSEGGPFIRVKEAHHIYNSVYLL